MLKRDKIYCIDHMDGMSQLDDNSIDLVPTDPPYGYSFMGKDWDKAVPPVETWRECLRVLKPGAFCFVMSAPRQDVLSRMVCNLQDAGFRTDFTSIYWAYASGFPKAMNIGKMVDKRGGRPLLNKDRVALATHIREQRKSHKLSVRDLAQMFPQYSEVTKNWERTDNGNRVPSIADYGTLIRELGCDPCYYTLIRNEEAKRKVVGHSNDGLAQAWTETGVAGYKKGFTLTIPATPQAKALNGSYAGFQPKPAVEIIIVAMKPLSEKTYVDQALKNGKGVTWLDDGRIPINKEVDRTQVRTMNRGIRPPDDGWGLNENEPDKPQVVSLQGRFPANLLVSDDVLNDGRVTESKPHTHDHRHETLVYGGGKGLGIRKGNSNYGDSGSFSRYFDLDAWWQQKIKELPKGVQETFPFLIVPKASKSEKNYGCEDLYWERDKSELGLHRIGRERWEHLREKEKKLLRETGRRVSLQARGNIHPTVKPIKLFSYLITLGSRPSDTILDPYVGSGTADIAGAQLGRHFYGFDDNQIYVEIANHRLSRSLGLFQ